RRRIGRRLAEEHPADADVVLAVPDSSNSIALGYSEVSGIRYELGLIRNHYVGRTFIQPDQSGRDSSVRIKFNPVRQARAWRRAVLVHRHSARGPPSDKLAPMPRKNCAAEVHFRICPPPVAFPCFYGINTPSRRELIAPLRTPAEIRDYLGADWIGYLS